MSDDLEAIRELKRRYVRCLDGHDWPGLAETLAGEVRIDVDGHPQGREGAVGHIRAILAPTRSRHRLGASRIRLTGEGTAVGIWEMSDEVVRIDPAGDAGKGWAGAGRYEEEYVREDGVWRISRMRLVRSRRTPLRRPSLPS